MKTLSLAFIGLVLFAQVPPPGANGSGSGDLRAAPAPYACALQADGTLSITGDPTVCAGLLKDQILKLQQQVAQKDQQIAAMQANIDASQDMISRCYQGLVDLHAKLPPKR